MSLEKENERAVLKLSDEELMKAYAEQGSYSAFEELYKRHSRLVYGFLTKKLHRKEMIDDVFQATWLKLHRFRSKYDPSLPFLPWLFTLSRNVMLDTLRAGKRIREEPHEDIALLSERAAEPAADEVPGHLETLRVNNWKEALSPEQREVISLRFGEDLSFDEIAKRLRIKSSGARKISQRAIEKLRIFFKYYGAKGR